MTSLTPLEFQIFLLPNACFGQIILNDSFTSFSRIFTLDMFKSTAIAVAYGIGP